MNSSGVRKVVDVAKVYVRPVIYTSLFGKKPTGQGLRRMLSRNIVTSSNQLSDKTKLPGTGSGGNGIVDSNGYSLDLDAKGQQELEKFKKVIEKNTYYDKYKAKIVETQKSTPNSSLGIIELLVEQNILQNKLKRMPNQSVGVGRALNPPLPFLGIASRKSPGVGPVLTLRPMESFPFINTGGSNMLGGIRPLVYYSLQKGKRKTVKTVLKRFFRLYWGAWIRPKAGRHRKVWRKNGKMKYRALQHVFCTATQSHMLDKMVSNFWKEKKYYVDDPYESYHKRDNFYITRKFP